MLIQEYHLMIIVSILSMQVGEVVMEILNSGKMVYKHTQLLDTKQERQSQQEDALLLLENKMLLMLVITMHKLILEILPK